MKERAYNSSQYTGLSQALANRRPDAKTQSGMACFLSRYLAVRSRNM